MAELTRRFDWSKTPVGPIDTWPDTLPTNGEPAPGHKASDVFVVGPELIQFYNDGIIPINSPTFHHEHHSSHCCNVL